MSGELELSLASWDLLATLGSQFCAYDKFSCPPNFERELPRGAGSIVGVSYRSKEGRSALAAKKVGNLLLLVREPANRHDPNAIAVYTARTNTEGVSGFTFVHCGYVPAVRAAQLCKSWPMSNGLPAIAEAALGEGYTILPNGRFRDYLGGYDRDWPRYRPGQYSAPGDAPNPQMTPGRYIRPAKLPPWDPRSRAEDDIYINPWEGSR